MIKHTDNPADRAVSVADREARSVWEETGSWERWMAAWLSIYEEALAKFVQPLES